MSGSSPSFGVSRVVVQPGMRWRLTRYCETARSRFGQGCLRSRWQRRGAGRRCTGRCCQLGAGGVHGEFGHAVAGQAGLVRRHATAPGNYGDERVAAVATVIEVDAVLAVAAPRRHARLLLGSHLAPSRIKIETRRAAELLELCGAEGI